MSRAVPVARVQRLQNIQARASRLASVAGARNGAMLAATEPEESGTTSAELWLYGIVGYEVRERRSELGLRMSLGATTGRAVWATSARGIALAVYGLVLGGVLGVAIAWTLLAGFLHGVEPIDPTTLVVVFGSLLIVAVAASLVPAARVARIDPAAVLRAG